MVVNYMLEGRVKQIEVEQGSSFAKIEYLQQAPKGEYAGTIFVLFAPDLDRDTTDLVCRCLDHFSTWGGSSRLLQKTNSHFWEIRSEDWNAALAVLSFAGGTEIFKWHSGWTEDRLGP